MGIALPAGLIALNGARMPSMAEDVAIVTSAACVRLAGVDRCGLLRDSAVMPTEYQNPATRYGMS